MTPQKLLYGKDAREKLAEGAKKLSLAVVSTLGPRSRNVAINKEWPAPTVTHDGVSVAKSIRLKDPFEDMGAVLLREAASKTNDLAGDGTTTATLLANTLIQEGMRLMGGVSSEGFIIGKANPMELQIELKKYADRIVEKLQQRAVEVKGREQYEKIAVISSASETMGKIVADSIEKVGADGIVMVEEGAGFETEMRVQEGMEFDNGFLSPYFVTDGDHMIAEYKDSYVLITDQRIIDANDLVPIIEKVIKEGGKPLLIIADDVIGPALQALVATKLRNVQPCIAVMAPEFADRRKEMLEDIAILTGGNVIAKDLGKRVNDATIQDLGRLKSMRVTQTHTTLTPANPDKEEIIERVNAIKEQIDKETNDFKKQRLEQRLSKLANGVVIIEVGGASETEIKERKMRIDDAVFAVKAALSEGVVPGAGMTLHAIADELEKETPEKERGAAYDLIQNMLRAPYKTILANAGYDPDEKLKLIQSMKELKDDVAGYNVVTGEVVPLLKYGIIDPVKVTRLAVIHAVSVASMILTTDTLISAEEDTNVQKMQLVNQ